MISTRGRYAIRVMIDMAEHKEKMTLDSIAQRQDVSKKYLETIAKDLVKAKMIKGLSGKGGGYILLKDPSEYRILDILKVMETSMSPVACLEEDAEPCLRAENCKTLPMWQKLDLIVSDFFGKITIQDLLDGNI